MLFSICLQVLVEQLNAAQKKPTIKIDRIATERWFQVQCVRLESWYDTTKKSQIHAIKLETNTFYFYVPVLQVEIFMKLVFGRKPDGTFVDNNKTAIPNGYNITDNIWLLQERLEFRIDNVSEEFAQIVKHMENPNETPLDQFPMFSVTFRTAGAAASAAALVHDE